MNAEDRMRELAPLFVLGALDGEELLEFREHVGGCADCQAELAAYTEVAGRIGSSVPAVPPSPAVRDRVLASVAAAPDRAPAVARPPVAWWPGILAAAVALAVGLLLTRAQLRDARRSAAVLEQQVEEARREVSDLSLQLVEAQAVRDLVARPGSRLTLLAGLQAAPQASARVIWDAASREAMLLASGLKPPPAGQTYEVWVIGASNQPVPAGLFQPAPDGSAVVRLPRVEDTAQPRTFAVTLEPAGGTSSPTGPMVLAGAVS